MKIGERKWHGSEEEEMEKLKKQREFGKYLRGLRNSKGLTTRQVGQALNISSNYVSEIERGLKAGSDEVIRELADLYKVPEKEVFHKAGRVSLSVVKMIVKEEDLHAILAKLEEMNQSDRKEVVEKFKEIID